jgi:lipopolysaccharide/colanic/teichoic acid biosynthesis glycosyltransferase
MLKRLVDILASAIGLIVLSPLLLILALAVKVTSPGPILYRATRVGRGGATFKLLKFRSMVINADKIGPAVTGAADPRITSVGRLLRRTKLDELPQLLNVLRGEMSLVGPRPEDPKYVALYTEAQRRVLDVRPGITSPASVTYRDEEGMLTGDHWEQYYIDTVMPAKLAIDLEYARNASVIRDIQVIWRTFKAIVRA